MKHNFNYILATPLASFSFASGIKFPTKDVQIISLLVLKDARFGTLTIDVIRLRCLNAK